MAAVICTNTTPKPTVNRCIVDEWSLSSLCILNPLASAGGKSLLREDLQLTHRLDPHPILPCEVVGSYSLSVCICQVYTHHLI